MKMNPPQFYKLLLRPVVVISTVSKNGISNAAPFSFNMPISFVPPIFSFSCNPAHDTWKNIKEGGEFVANIVGEDFGPLMQILEKDFPYETSEITEAGLTETKSNHIAPPRIKEAYAWLECKMIHNVELGDHIFIAGEVLEAEIKDEFIDKTVILDKAKPLSHVAGPFFGVGSKPVDFKRA